MGRSAVAPTVGIGPTGRLGGHGVADGGAMSTRADRHHAANASTVGRVVARPGRMLSVARAFGGARRPPRTLATKGVGAVALGIATGHGWGVAPAHPDSVTERLPECLPTPRSSVASTGRTGRLTHRTPRADHRPTRRDAHGDACRLRARGTADPTPAIGVLVAPDRIDVVSTGKGFGRVLDASRGRRPGWSGGRL